MNLLTPTAKSKPRLCKIVYGMKALQNPDLTLAQLLGAGKAIE